MELRGYAASALAMVAAGLGAGCAAEEAASSDTITLYTCASDTTVEPVIESFEASTGTESSCSGRLPVS